MSLSVCMLAIILLTIFVEQGFTKGGRGGGRGSGRSGGASYGGYGAYGGSGTGGLDGDTTAILMGSIAGGIGAAFLLCLIVSCIRKYVCGKRSTAPTYKPHGLPTFKVQDAEQALPKRGILKSESKAGNTGSTNFSQTKTESTVESLGPPPSYHTVDKSPPPSYSRIDEEVLMYVPLESETNQHTGSIVRHMCNYMYTPQGTRLE